MNHFRLRFGAALGAMTLLQLSDPAWSQAQSPPVEGDAGNSGQDPARPVRRFDLRLQYQQIDDDLEAVISTLRMDWPFVFGDGWKISTRIDVPLTTNNVPSPDNMDGDWEFGLSDVLLQGLLIRPLNHAALIAGSQVIIPTATQDHFGSGKLRLVPTVGAVYYPSCRAALSSARLRDTTSTSQATTIERMSASCCCNQSRISRCRIVGLSPSRRSCGST
jgi:hypothetical protein